MAEHHELDEIVVLISCSCGAVFVADREHQAYDYWADHAEAAERQPQESSP